MNVRKVLENVRSITILSILSLIVSALFIAFALYYSSLFFGFPIPDNVPPGISRLAVYDRNKSTYNQSPKIYAVKKVNGVYTKY